MNIFLIGAAALIIVYLVSVTFLSSKVFESFAKHSDFDPMDLKKIYYTLNKNGRTATVSKITKGIDWYKNTEHEDVGITSRDGFKLHAKLYVNTDGIGKTAVLAHGYKAMPELDFSVSGKALYDLGYNLLLIDERAHGESEGEYITFGSKEQYDLLDWCKWTVDRFGADSKYILFGISEGAASAILASCMQDIPQNLDCVIADSAYTDVKSLFRNVFSRLPVPKFILMPLMNSFCKSRAKFNLNDFDISNIISLGARVPYMFIHGENDDFVSSRNTEKIFEACEGEKQLVIIPEAGHGKSFDYDTERYISEIDAFVKKYSIGQ
ncbi:MAG: alpha/beta hydrolase [Clostridiales bacterium]|nr:alpha/beta hydrolase [Clostridiales bacterium]